MDRAPGELSFWVLILAGILLVISIAWLFLPFIIISKLNEVRRRIEESNALLKSGNADLREISKNTSRVSKDVPVRPTGLPPGIKMED